VLRQTTPRQRDWLRSRPLGYDTLIAALDLPVLVTHGERDPVLLASHAENLRRALPRAWVSHYGGAGHAPFLDDPERFGNELIDFAHEVAA
jgi:pimeloyl-ACP methyl ester carboxylesterase